MGKPEKTRKPRKTKKNVTKISIKPKVFKDFASEYHENLRVSLICFTLFLILFGFLRFSYFLNFF